MTPWYYKNNPAGQDDGETMIEGTNICMPALWCKDRTMVAYSLEGFQNKSWRLPSAWQDVQRVALARITDDGVDPIGETDVQNHTLTLTLERGKRFGLFRPFRVKGKPIQPHDPLFFVDCNPSIIGNT